MHQTIKTYLEREHCILLSVTRTLYVRLAQVCHGVGRCVKDASCCSSSSSLEWKLMGSINGISYYLSNVRCYQTHYRWHFVFQGDSALVHMQCACNTVQLLRRSQLPFSCTTPPNSPSWAHWLQDLGSHTAAWVWVVSQKYWRNQGRTIVEFWQVSEWVSRV